jgi:short subunit dehydrogenase-like uncharacterized protein
LPGATPPNSTASLVRLGLERRAFGLDDPAAIDSALNRVAVVLNCAGPFKDTAEPLVEACVRSRAHYLDITGEIPVYEAIQARDAQAKARGIMLLPGVGFDVVPTDCLALHLKQRLPSATRLRLAFQSVGPAGLPPGTQQTAIERLNFGERVRRNGKLVRPQTGGGTISVDFGCGPVDAVRVRWGDVFTAYFQHGHSRHRRLRRRSTSATASARNRPDNRPVDKMGSDPQSPAHGGAPRSERRAACADQNARLG